MAKRPISFFCAIVLFVGTLALGVRPADADWTEDYDCDETVWEPTYHNLDWGISDWGDTTHPYIPGDCEVHSEYGGGEGGA